MRTILIGVVLVFALPAWRANAQIIYADPAPVVSYYAPAAPRVSYYAPASSYSTPVSAYYSSAPVTSYYAPSTAYYGQAPATAYYAPSTVVPQPVMVARPVVVGRGYYRRWPVWSY